MDILLYGWSENVSSQGAETAECAHQVHVIGAIEHETEFCEGTP
jgi:hypothetical protein